MSDPNIKSRLLEKISASKLILFHQCRLKFYFRYFLGLKKPKTTARHVGSTVHSTLKAWNLLRWRKEFISPDVLKIRFEQNWVSEQEKEPVDWDEPEELVKKEGWSILDTYFRDTPIQQEERPEAVEVSIDAEIAGMTKLVGILDLVRPGGNIVDFKTVGQTPNPQKAAHLNEIQLSCYSLLYRDATGLKEGGLELHHLVKLKTPKLIVTSLDSMSDKQKTRLFRIVESYLKGVDREDWVPNPNPMTCSCCEFFQECRAWG